MIERSVRIWQQIFNRHVDSLTTDEEMPKSELEHHLKQMIDLINLRWSIHKNSEPKTLDSIPKEAASKPTPKPRKGGEEDVWWNRKTRYSIFDRYAKVIILRGADHHKLKTHLTPESSNDAFLRALAKMTHKKMPKLSTTGKASKKSFATSILRILSPKKDIEDEDKNRGLSYLLADLEKVLGLYRSWP